MLLCMFISVCMYYFSCAYSRSSDGQPDIHGYRLREHSTHAEVHHRNWLNSLVRDAKLDVSSLSLELRTNIDNEILVVGVRGDLGKCGHACV